MFTPELKARVLSEVARYIAIANAHYKPSVPYQMPQVRFDVRGTVGGKANHKKWWVNYNTVLLCENVEEFFAHTVPHEVAHLIERANQKAQFGRVLRGKGSSHGPSWQKVMHVFGVKDPTRCHQYDVTNSRVRTVNRARFEYACKCRTYNLGPKRHKAVQLGNVRGLYCPKCKTVFTPAHYKKSTAPVVQAPVVVKPTPVKMVPPTGPMTKTEQVLRMVRSDPTADRDEMIRRIMSNCGMSKAGAQTYYYNAKKALTGNQQ